MRISDWSSDVCSSDLLIATILLQCLAPAVDAAQWRAQIVRHRIAECLEFRVRHVQLMGAIRDPPFETGVELMYFLLRQQQRAIALGQHIDHRDDGLAQLFKRSEEHTSELQSLMRISYDVFCLKKKKQNI